MTRERSRVIVQYLEGGAAAGLPSAEAAVARLRRAAAILPIDDVCLGWNLPAPLVANVVRAAHDLGAAVWLWHPLLSGDGRYVPGPDRVLGASGRPVEAPGGMGEFAFDCAVRPGGRDAALQRLTAALTDAPWDGVFLDKIRWPSPTADPATDLGCFCDACARESGAAGVDLAEVRAMIRSAPATAAGRLAMVAALMGLGTPTVLSRYLDWRCRVITQLVERAATMVGEHETSSGAPLRVGLDVFAPCLARAVGQDTAALAPHAEFTKAMLYLGTHGPAGMAFELARLGSWLREGGVRAPGAELSAWCGFPVAEPTDLRSGSLSIAALDHELAELERLAGRRAAVGVDAVWIANLAILDDSTLGEVAARAARAGLPVVISWDLQHVSDTRLARISHALGEPATSISRGGR